MNSLPPPLLEKPLRRGQKKTWMPIFGFLKLAFTQNLLQEGKRIHQLIVNNNEHISDYTVLEKLTCMYIACGDIDIACNVFDQIQRPNAYLWNSRIRAYAWNGPFDCSIEFYYKMIDSGTRPNKFTFPFVLKACSSLQALEDGKKIHEHAKRIGLDTDVFVCTTLIDFYAKCGCLSEAQKLFDKMPNRDVVAWNAVVAGSALHGLYEDTIMLVLEMQCAGNGH